MTAAPALPFDEKLHNLIYASHLSDLHMPVRHVFHLRSNDPASKAFEMISAKDVHSAPVRNPETHEWLGIVDLKDFVKYVLYLHEHKALPYHKITDDNRPLSDIMNIAGDSAWISVNDVHNLGELLQRMYLCRYHRLPVMSMTDPSKLLGMVAQLDVVKWLHNQHIDKASAAMQLNVKDLGLVRSGKQVFSATLHTSLLEVYRYLSAKDVSACAIVDQVGHLVGNVSVSDLKFKMFEDLRNLEMTVEEYLKISTARHFPIYVHEDAKLGEVIGQLAEASVHRVYVCSKDRLCLGVITLSDVIAVMAQLIAKKK